MTTVTELNTFTKVIKNICITEKKQGARELKHDATDIPNAIRQLMNAFGVYLTATTES